MPDTLSALSYFQLLLEFLDHGCAKLETSLEPIPINQIVLELENRSGLTYGYDLIRWVEWIIRTNQISDEEKKTLGSILNMRAIELNALSSMAGKYKDDI